MVRKSLRSRRRPASASPRTSAAPSAIGGCSQSPSRIAASCAPSASVDRHAGQRLGAAARPRSTCRRPPERSSRLVEIEGPRSGCPAKSAVSRGRRSAAVGRRVEDDGRDAVGDRHDRRLGEPAPGERQRNDLGRRRPDAARTFIVPACGWKTPRKRKPTRRRRPPLGSGERDELRRVRHDVVVGDAVQQHAVALAEVDQRAGIAEVDGEARDVVGRAERRRLRGRARSAACRRRRSP